MSGKITFVGAGPGAADLITVRGAKILAEADLVIYAGSLVNEAILSYAGNAECVSSGDMNINEIIELMSKAWEAGKNVVRLHTGDPSIYGAVGEQFRELEKLNIPFEVVPGVSSALAAAAALKIEFTEPEISQRVIFTRVAGRTPLPDGERIEDLTSGTLCMFLSVSALDKLSADLIRAGRRASTPVAVVYRASWPDEEIVYGTLENIGQKAAVHGVKRQAMVVIGDVLDPGKIKSKLYDAEFVHGYRNDRFYGKCAIFALTPKGIGKATQIASGLAGSVIFTPEKFTSLVPELRRMVYPDGGFSAAFARAWKEFDAIIAVTASGIVVRHAAGLVNSKKVDPAVVVCDENGDYAISLLSGHIGGANRLARAVAAITGGKPVITTASDCRGIMALDELAAKYHYRIVNPDKLTEIAQAILENKLVSLKMPEELFARYYSGMDNVEYLGDSKDVIEVKINASGVLLKMVKRRFALGIGCRRGIAGADLKAEVGNILQSHSYSWNDINLIASAELKKDEPGLLALAEELGTPVKFFSGEELNSIQVNGVSHAAQEHLGINSVSEAAALLAAGNGAKLIFGKTASGSTVTAALVEIVEE